MNELLSALVQLGIIDRATADRINRNLDPIQAQAWAEGRLYDEFAVALDGQRDRLLRLVDATSGRPTQRQLDAFWRAEDDAFFANVQRGLYDVAQERAITSIVTTGAFDMWETVNQRVIDWVNDYYTNLDAEIVGSIPNLNATGRTEFARAFIDWQRGELETAGYADGLPQLIRAIEPTFGQVRASRIATTETTRIHYEATYQAANANEFVTHLRWYTAADEIVARCPICGPMHLAVTPKASRTWQHPTLGPISIPAHVNCRCVSVEETALTIQTALPPEEQWQYTPPPAPTPPAAPEQVTPTPPTPSWMPSMSRQDALSWSSNSVYANDEFYHVTKGVNAERSIMDNGFDLSKKKFGRMWGDGVYVGVDSETTTMIRKWTGPGARTLTAKVNVNNPFVFSSSSGFTQSDIVAKALDVKLSQARSMLKNKTITEILSDAGYDALRIEPSAVNEGAGGRQMIIFDPKNITVIRP